MSQFDLPRINFSGNAIINPPTANNNSFYPLVLFDHVYIKVFMPPRIYLSEKQTRMHAMGLFVLPDDVPVLIDGAHHPYIEISTVNDRQVFKQWAVTPLGESPFDTPFHPLYNVIRTSKGNRMLAGSVPSNWNYFGGMEFGFDHAIVTSVDVSDKESNFIHYTGNEDDCPDQIQEIMHAPVTFQNEKGKYTAVMVDVIPSLPFYTQIFCDLFTVGGSEKKLLAGKPTKASLRFLNPDRIINQAGAVAGSGTFYCVIPTSDLLGGLHAPVLQLFRQYHPPDAAIAGVFIRYDLLEVKENQHPDYHTLGSTANPARCTISGSITPWYGSEMNSIAMSRQMIPVSDYLPEKRLSPFVFQINKEKKLISLDLVGSLPQIYTEGGYQMYDLGELKIKCRIIDYEEIDVCSIFVNNKELNRDRLFDIGGIVNVPIVESFSSQIPHIENGLFLIYGLSKQHAGEQGFEVLLMQESEYMVSTDQVGIYVNQYDDAPAEPCRISVYTKGKPFDGAVAMTIRELRIKPGNNLPVVSTFMETTEFRNNQELQFSFLEPMNAIYILYPGNTKASNKPTTDILQTGFFINLRVLPKHDYGKYLDPQHPQYPTPVTFELIYKEILEVYDLIYPISSIITPFNDEYFKRGWKFIKQRLSPDNWVSSTYMPSSRDMSYDQWQLLCKWGEKIELPEE